MCISFGQKDFRYNDILKSDKSWSELIRLAQSLNPKSYRVNMFKPGVIFTSSKIPEVSKAQFTWIEKKDNGKTWPVFNIRCEGGWNNKENSRKYSGPFHIYKNPYAKNLIQYNRCIVPCDFFIEQPKNKNIKKKYLIRKNNKEPIHLGGIYKQELDETTGELSTYFAIITTPPTKATLAADHHRSPLVIPDSEVMNYLNPELTAKELNHYFKSNAAKGYEVFEVDPDITGKKEKYDNNDERWVQARSEVIPID